MFIHVKFRDTQLVKPYVVVILSSLFPQSSVLPVVTSEQQKCCFCQFFSANSAAAQEDQSLSSKLSPGGRSASTRPSLPASPWQSPTRQGIPLHSCPSRDCHKNTARNNSCLSLCLFGTRLASMQGKELLQALVSAIL